eukprot:69126-Amphidinium_carterae.1
MSGHQLSTSASPLWSYDAGSQLVIVLTLSHAIRTPSVKLKEVADRTCRGTRTTHWLQWKIFNISSLGYENFLLLNLLRFVCPNS